MVSSYMDMQYYAYYTTTITAHYILFVTERIASRWASDNGTCCDASSFARRYKYGDVSTHDNLLSPPRGFQPFLLGTVEQTHPTLPALPCCSTIQHER